MMDDVLEIGGVSLEFEEYNKEAEVWYNYEYLADIDRTKAAEIVAWLREKFELTEDA